MPGIGDPKPSKQQMAGSLETPSSPCDWLWALRQTQQKPSMVNGGPDSINKKSLAVTYTQGRLAYAVHQEPPLNSWAPGYDLLIHASESTIRRELVVRSFNQWTETCPVQSKLLNANQSESITPTNQNCAIQTFQNHRN